MSFQLSWLWLIGAGVLALGGSALTAWALFSDRSRGRKRCPKCWYDMSATAGLKCPECGREARGEQRLFRTRRRWRWVVVGVGLVVGAWPVLKAPEMMKHGWMVLIPTDVLLRIAPIDQAAFGAEKNNLSPAGWEWTSVAPRGKMLAELMRRVYGSDPLSARQWRHFLNRYFHRYPAALGQVIRTRPAWPRDIPVAVRVNWSGLFPSMGTVNDADVRATVGIAGYEPARTIRRGETARIEAPPINASTFSVAIRVEWRGELIWEGVGPVIQVVDRIDQIARGYDGVGATRSVRSAVFQPLVAVDDGRYVVAFHRSCCHLDVSQNDVDWALGMRLKLIQGDRVVADGTGLYHQVQFRTNASFGNMFVFFVLSPVNPSAKPSITNQSSYWKLWISGDGPTALSDFSRNEYWDGSFEMDVLKPVTDTGDSYFTADVRQFLQYAN